MLSSSELIKLRRQSLEDNNHTNGLNHSEMLRIKKIGYQVNKQISRPYKSVKHYSSLSHNSKYITSNQRSGISSSDLLHIQKGSVIDNSKEKNLSSSQLLELRKKSIQNDDSSKQPPKEHDTSTITKKEPTDQVLVFRNIEHVVADNISTRGNITIEGTITGKKSLSISDEMIIGDNLMLNNDNCTLSLGVNSDFKITHDGSTGASITGNPINITAAGESTFKTTSGDLIIHSEMASLNLEGQTGITLENSSNDITINSFRDINLTATSNVTIDGEIIAKKSLTIDEGIIGKKSLTIDGEIIGKKSLTIDEGIIGKKSLAIDGEIIGKESLIIENDITIGDNLSLQSNECVLSFGDDNDITLTHVENTGLKLKNNSTNGNSGIGCVLTLQTGDIDISSGDILGSIDFQAPNESSSLDSTEVAARISAISESDFSSSNNATTLSFKTSSSGTPVENMTLDSVGNLSCVGDFNCGGTLETSDIRLKKDISPLENSLEIINKLRSVSFNWKDRLNKNKKIGFLAQEVEKVLPEVVSTSTNGYKSIAYSSMISLLVDGFQCQQQMINKLNQKLLESEK